MGRPVESNGAPARCVIIDDDPSMIRLLSRLVVDTLGDPPVTFDNPEDAINYADPGQPISVILLDWHIGDFDGLQLIEPLGRRWPSAVFIIISADSNPRAFVEALRKCSLALWWRKTDSMPILASLLNVAVEEHKRREAGEGRETLAEIKDRAIRSALAQHRGDVEVAAKQLGISVSTVRRHIASR